MDTRSSSLPVHLVLIVALFAFAADARAQGPNDKYKSPRATLRTLYTSIELVREDPRHIEDAAGCLDLGERPQIKQYAGLLATKLEAILRAKEVTSAMVPKETSDEIYTIPDMGSHRLALRRTPDGRYLFDRDTVLSIPKVWAEVNKTLLEKNREAAALNVAPGFASPRATFRTFQTAIHRLDMGTAVRCLDLEEVPAVARHEVGYQLVNKLEQVINRQRLVVLQEIPETNYSLPYVFFSQPVGVIEITRQYSGPRKGEWLFSAATVQSIDNLYDAFEEQPYVPEVVQLVTPRVRADLWHASELWLRDHLPAWARSRLISSKDIHIEVYEVIGYLVLFTSMCVVYRLARWLLVAAVAAGLRRIGAHISRETLAARLRAAAFLASILCLRWGVLLLSVDRVLLVVLLTVLNPLLWLTAAWAVSRLIDLFGDVIEERLAMSRHRVVTTQMMLPVGSLATKIAVFLATIFHLMQLFSWEVSAVVTGLGISGLAFALGAQDSLKNLFGSFTLIADRPFVVGEKVKIGERGEGVVEVVGLRSTRIRTSDDAVLTVPNSDLTTMHITNYGKRRYSRFETTLGVAFSTPPERLIAFRDGIRALILEQPHTNKDRFDVRVDDLGASGIEIRVTVWFDISRGGSESEAREALILEVLRLAEKLHVEFAFSTHLVHLAPAAGASGEAGPRLGDREVVGERYRAA